MGYRWGLAQAGFVMVVQADWEGWGLVDSCSGKEKAGVTCRGCRIGVRCRQSAVRFGLMIEQVCVMCGGGGSWGSSWWADTSGVEFEGCEEDFHSLRSRSLLIIWKW